MFIFICLVVRHDEFRAKFKKFCHTKRRKAKQSSDIDAAYTKVSSTWYSSPHNIRTGLHIPLFRSFMFQADTVFNNPSI